MCTNSVKMVCKQNTDTKYFKSSKLIKHVSSSVFLSNLFCVSHFSAVSYFFSPAPRLFFFFIVTPTIRAGRVNRQKNMCSEKLTHYVCARLKKVRNNERERRGQIVNVRGKGRDGFHLNPASLPRICQACRRRSCCQWRCGKGVKEHQRLFFFPSFAFPPSPISLFAAVSALS